MGSHFVSLLLVLCLIFFSLLVEISRSQSFKCSVRSSCRSMVGYVCPNATSLSSMEALFQVKNHRSVLGANNFPAITSPKQIVRAGETTRIPIRCRCRNGTGVTDGRPVYTTARGDSLYHIAVDLFAGLVTYQEIAAANNVTDLIVTGQRLRIPLPCSCDPVNGERAVHYGHIVKAGSSLEAIAKTYGTTSELLTSINGLHNQSFLSAGQLLDIPLRACNSSVREESADYPFLASNDSYVFTAHNCVKCTCSSANNWLLQCEPSGVKPSNWSTCPSMRCDGAQNLLLGNATTSASGCDKTTCAYAGFLPNQTILTTLVTESTCTAAGSAPTSYTAGVGLNWDVKIPSLITVHLFLLGSQFL